MNIYVLLIFLSISAITIIGLSSTCMLLLIRYIGTKKAVYHNIKRGKNQEMSGKKEYSLRPVINPLNSQPRIFRRVMQDSSAHEIKLDYSEKKYSIFRQNFNFICIDLADSGDELR
ncbi:MAG: hypothetical protein PHR06_02315 [Candidatus Cloacimonetes bacterium]|nr:hypothetical protein [Candidatus Cloacimonadota bacterium]